MLFAVLYASRHAHSASGSERVRGVRQSIAGFREGGGCHREHLQAVLQSCVPRVLHTRLVHCRQKADVSLLQGEGGSTENVSQSVCSWSGWIFFGNCVKLLFLNVLQLGEATRTLWQAAGLDSLVGRMAATYIFHSTRHQLDAGPGIDQAPNSQSNCV